MGVVLDQSIFYIGSFSNIMFINFFGVYNIEIMHNQEALYIKNLVRCFCDISSSDISGELGLHILKSKISYNSKIYFCGASSPDISGEPGTHLYKTKTPQIKDLWGVFVVPPAPTFRGNLGYFLFNISDNISGYAITFCKNFLLFILFKNLSRNKLSFLFSHGYFNKSFQSLADFEKLVLK